MLEEVDIFLFYKLKSQDLKKKDKAKAKSQTEFSTVPKQSQTGNSVG